MAKKKAAHSAPKRGKTKAPKKQSRKTVDKVLSGPVRRTPVPPKRLKTPALPGMEDKSKLSKKLLDIMDSMSDHMHTINESNITLKGLVNNAMQQMKRDTVMVAKAHGIELVRVPGDEKLRKKLLDASTVAAEEDSETAGEDDLDNGEGEDAAFDGGADGQQDATDA